MPRLRLLSMPVLLLASLAAGAGVCAQETTPRTSQGKTQKVRNPLNDLLDEAQAALDKSDYEAAIPPLQKFIHEKPGVAYAHFQLAYAYTALKRVDEARAEYERATALDPKMGEAHLNLGILLLEKDPAAAVKPLQRAVELLPAQSRPRYLLGIALESSGNPAAAAEAFEAASRLDPSDTDALEHLGGSLLRAGNPAEAETKFRAALERQPESPAALQGLARSLDAQKKTGAVEAYRKYLAVEPNDRAARSRLIQILTEQQQFDAALEESKKDPAGQAGAQAGAVDALKQRADIEIGQKKYDEAIGTLQQALKLAPQDATLHGAVGRLYMQKRDFAAAERELKAALQLDRSNLVYWKDLSSTYYLAGNCPAALEGLDLIARVETPGAGTWFIRALCYDKLVQVKPALDAYRKFLELDENRNPDQVWQANQRIHVLEKMAGKKK